MGVEYIGWTWVCGYCGDEAVEAFDSQVLAEDDYAKHQQEHDQDGDDD